MGASLRQRVYEEKKRIVEFEGKRIIEMVGQDLKQKVQQEEARIIKEEKERQERERLERERKEREDNMANFVQQVASGKHYDQIKSIGISHPDLKKLANYHFNSFGSMDKSKFEIGYDQNNQIIPFGEICWVNGGDKYFAIGQINDSDLNLKNTAQSNQMLVDGGM